MGSRKHKRGRPVGRRVLVTLESAEIARGHDGFLRGKPEPVLLFAAFSAGASGPARPLGRALRRLRVTTPFPSICVPDEPALIRGTAGPDHDRIAVVGVALEADSGADVEAVFAALGETDGFSVWTTRAPTPNPRTIEEAARASLPPAPEAACVRVMRAGSDLEDGCRADEWVGACLVVQPVGQDVRCWRMHFASRDGRNDWTAAVRVRG